MVAVVVVGVVVGEFAEVPGRGHEDNKNWLTSPGTLLRRPPGQEVGASRGHSLSRRFSTCAAVV